MVHKDFCDVSLHKKLYRCDSKLRGDKVLLRCPLGTVPNSLEIYDLKGRKKIGAAQLHDRSQREIPTPPPLPEETVNIEEVLKKINKHRMDRELLSLPTVTPDHLRQVWSLEQFIDSISQLVGCDLTHMDQHDIHTLSEIHKNQKNLCLKKLKFIWKICSPQTLNQLILELAKEGL